MSGVGMAGVLLTGVISIFVIGPEGRIHSATPWLFAGKEALIPLILAAAVVVSRSTGTPLLNMFIYTPELFDVRRIEQTARNRLTRACWQTRHGFWRAHWSHPPSAISS